MTLKLNFMLERTLQLTEVAMGFLSAEMPEGPLTWGMWAYCMLKWVVGCSCLCKAVSVYALMKTLIDSSVSWTIFPGNSEEISIFLKITLHFLHIWHLKVRRLGSSFRYFFSWIKLKLISSGFVMNAVLVNINWL